MKRRLPILFTLCILIAVFPAIITSSPRRAYADSARHTLRAEAALALMVGAQTERFSLGGGAGGGYEYRIIPHLGVEARYGAFFFPVRDRAVEQSSFGGLHSISLGLRAYPLPHLERGELWIGIGGGAGFTGELTRGGIDGGVGFEFKIQRILQLGPFLRYAHIFQPAGHELGGGDGGFLELGLSLAIRPSKRSPEAEMAAEIDEDVEQEQLAQADGGFDLDTASETQDELIDEAPESFVTAHGGPESTGEREMREVAERILFPNSSDEPIRETMTAVLRVAQLIHDHPEWEKITIEGHASETGSAATNLELSRQRAERMKQILVDFGIDPDRIEVVAKGKSELEVRGRSESAHAQNRRVVFIVTVMR